MSPRPPWRPATRLWPRAGTATPCPRPWVRLTICWPSSRGRAFRHHHHHRQSRVLPHGAPHREIDELRRVVHLADLKAQIEAERDLSTSLALDREPAARAM